MLVMATGAALLAAAGCGFPRACKITLGRFTAKTLPEFFDGGV
jgi:hypothetical protein